MMILFFKLVEAMQIVVVRQALFDVWRLFWVWGLSTGCYYFSPGSKSEVSTRRNRRKLIQNVNEF